MAEPVDLKLCLAYALGASLMAAFGHSAALLTACVAPLVLLAPGYATLAALEGSDRRISVGRRLVLAVALSMAIVVLDGLVLNLVTGLNRTAWTASLVLITAVSSLVGIFRHMRSARADRGPAESRASRYPLHYRFSLLGAFATAAIALYISFAVVLTELTAHSDYNQPITQLSLLPAPGRPGITVSIRNLSSKAERYSLMITQPGHETINVALQIPPSRSWVRFEPVHRGALHATLTDIEAGRRVVRQVTSNA